MIQDKPTNKLVVHHTPHPQIPKRVSFLVTPIIDNSNKGSVYTNVQATEKRKRIDTSNKESSYDEQQRAVTNAHSIQLRSSRSQGKVQTATEPKRRRYQRRNSVTASILLLQMQSSMLRKACNVMIDEPPRELSHKINVGKTVGGRSQAFTMPVAKETCNDLGSMIISHIYRSNKVDL